MKEKPASIRIEVPEKYGLAYTSEDGRQWVDRRQRVGGPGLKVLDSLGQKLTQMDDKAFDKAFEQIKKVLADVITDWNLEGDEGPLPKPWQEPKAFQALYDSNFGLLMWVGSLPFQAVGELIDLKN